MTISALAQWIIFMLFLMCPMILVIHLWTLEPHQRWAIKQKFKRFFLSVIKGVTWIRGKSKMDKKLFEYSYRDICGDITENNGVYHWSSKEMKDMIVAEAYTVGKLIHVVQASVDDYFDMRDEITLNQRMK